MKFFSNEKDNEKVESIKFKATLMRFFNRVVEFQGKKELKHLVVIPKRS